MVVPYLKKSKMYKKLSELLPEMDICKKIQCEYKFYRGSEWLKFAGYENGDGNIVVFGNFYHHGYFFSLDLEYREANDTDVLRKIVRRTYRLQSDSTLRMDYESIHDY